MTIWSTYQTTVCGKRSRRWSTRGAEKTDVIKATAFVRAQNYLKA